jgi:hypothetical protein
VTCKYFFSSDTIELPLLKWSLYDYYGYGVIIDIGIRFKEDEDWLMWKASLVHEMLHEYEHKCGSLNIEEGRNLKNEMKSQNLSFADQDGSGYKHTLKFYAAVFEKARYFDMSPLELAKKIQ